MQSHIRPLAAPTTTATATFPTSTTTSATTTATTTQITTTAPPAVGPTLLCPPNVTVDCVTPLFPGANGIGFPTLLNCGFVVPSYNDVRVNDTLAGTCNATSPCGYVRRTWTAVGCPNSNALCCDTFIVIADPSPPVMVCPASVQIPCFASTSPYDIGFATATSQCAPVTVVIAAQNSPALCGRTIERVWSGESGGGCGQFWQPY